MEAVTLEHHYQQSKSKHWTINTYKLTHVGQSVPWVRTVPVTPGKVRQDREGLRVMGSFQWRYSQQDVIDSELGGGKASRQTTAATAQPFGFFILS